MKWLDMYKTKIMQFGEGNFLRAFVDWQIDKLNETTDLNAGIAIIRPIDYDTIIESVKKTNRCVIVDESWPVASIASELGYWLQRYAFDYLDAPVYRVMQSDTPLAFSKPLIAEALPNTRRVVNAVKATLYRN